MDRDIYNVRYAYRDNDLFFFLPHIKVPRYVGQLLFFTVYTLLLLIIHNNYFAVKLCIVIASKLNHKNPSNNNYAKLFGFIVILTGVQSIYHRSTISHI